MTQQDPAWLDSMYNNRSLVPDYATYFERWLEMSKEAKSNQPCTLDMAYGKAGGERLDVFPTEKKTRLWWFLSTADIGAHSTNQTTCSLRPPSQRKARASWCPITTCAQQ